MQFKTLILSIVFLIQTNLIGSQALKDDLSRTAFVTVMMRGKVNNEEDQNHKDYICTTENEQITCYKNKLLPQLVSEGYVTKNDNFLLNPSDFYLQRLFLSPNSQFIKFEEKSQEELCKDLSYCEIFLIAEHELKKIMTEGLDWLNKNKIDHNLDANQTDFLNLLKEMLAIKMYDERKGWTPWSNEVGEKLHKLALGYRELFSTQSKYWSKQNFDPECFNPLVLRDTYDKIHSTYQKFVTHKDLDRYHKFINNKKLLAGSSFAAGIVFQIILAKLWFSLRSKKSEQKNT
jgi:hypothetical protein